MLPNTLGQSLAQGQDQGPIQDQGQDHVESTLKGEGLIQGKEISN